MNFISNYSVQEYMKDEDEKSYLHRPLFNVNMRLYKSSKKYRKLIKNTIKYMKSLFGKEYYDYSKIKGVSGANLGIPFNIIVVLHGKKIVPMINPKITHRIVPTINPNNEISIIKTNCGSLQLSKPITIKRFNKIRVQYTDIEGKYIFKYFDKPTSFTIQHEIDHNNGITVEDRYKEIEMIESVLY